LGALVYFVDWMVLVVLGCSGCLGDFVCFVRLGGFGILGSFGCLGVFDCLGGIGCFGVFGCLGVSECLGDFG
jgi:hypothetical protein